MKAEGWKDRLVYQRKNFWKTATPREREEAQVFAAGYMKFLNTCKTERETVTHVASLMEKKGFHDIDIVGKADRLFRSARGKNLALAVIGNQPLTDGINLIVSHIDTPRVDLKQNPLSEDSTTELAVLRTHYYGGVKKYQWMSTPLSLHGVVIKDNGETVNISIGEKEKEPVFIMPDLLPHLASREQYSKKIGDAVSASHMQVVFGSMPYEKEAEKLKEAVKLNILYLLHQKYGIVEEDLLSAELQLVPAGKARNAGLDGSLISAYGQDDRVCAYASLQALFSLQPDKLDRTAVIYLADKEEIGSESNTGAKSAFMLDFLADLLKYNQESADSMNLRKTLIKSQIISADVNAAINPNFPEVHEKDNAVHLGFGVSVTKYTGSRGKSMTNDANAEFNSKIIRILNAAGVNWQTGMLGKVDEGGGGTIAKFMAEYGAEVIDCGPGLLGMHSLYELSSKADVYSAYRAYRAFFEKA
ncbi:MAG: aminopeptidase [Candidatus Cloacimonetes bacterium]|nr:aminopeptidase [Candidatus Cloacimonadota bacterium]